MSNLIAKIVFGKILGESKDNNQGRDDPYFENVPTNKMSYSGKPKTKRRKKALPPGLSKEDEKTLVKVKRRAYRLDMALGTCCGMKLGWSSLIGFIPAVGDVLDLLLAMMVIRTASEVGLPSDVKGKMVFNVVIDFLVGLVPFLGDLADMAFKANTRNAIVLENYLRTRGAENIRKQGLPQQPDPSLGEEVPENTIVSHQPITEPPPTYQSGGGGWFSGLRGGGRPVNDDVEAQRQPQREPSRSQPSSSRREGNSKSHRSSSKGHGKSSHSKSSHSKSSRSKTRTSRQESGITKGY